MWLGTGLVPVLYRISTGKYCITPGIYCNFQKFPDVMCFEFCVLSRETAGHLNPHHLLHFLVMNPKSVFNRAFVFRPKL